MSISQYFPEYKKRRVYKICLKTHKDKANVGHYYYFVSSKVSL